MSALDIGEAQILVYYENDPQTQWHHRILVRHLREAVWGVAPPDSEIQVADLGVMRIIPLAQSGQLPAERLGNNYMFDPVDEATLATFHATASRMAEVLGGATPSAGDRLLGQACWVIADTSLETFGDEVADDVVHPDAAIVREPKCLLFILALLVHYDQADTSNPAGAEYACRRLLMIERAVKGTNVFRMALASYPKVPSSAGLHKMIEQSLDESGGSMTVEFTPHIAKLSEAEARVMKQQRLLREEIETPKTTPDDKGKKPRRWQKNRGKNSETPAKE
jgi:hypothetical protein